MESNKRTQDFGVRLRVAIELAGLKPAEFARKVGLKPNTLNNYLQGVSEPKFDVLLKIVQKLGVTTDYLLTKQHFSPQNVQDDVQDNVQVSTKDKINPTILPVQSTTDEEEAIPYRRSAYKPDMILLSDKPPLVIVVDAKNEERISMVDTRAAAGYPQQYLETEYIRDLPTFNLPSREFQEGTFRCFQVRGNSMATTFSQGDWVIARFVDNWPQNIRNGYVYVVVTATEVLIKRVTNRILERRTIVIQSDNEEYETEEIHAGDVLELWYVKARMSFKFPNTRFESTRKIRELEADFLDLRNEVQLLKNDRQKAH